MNPEIYREKINGLYQTFNQKNKTTDLEKAEYHSLMNLYINQYHSLNKKNSKTFF